MGNYRIQRVNAEFQRQLTEILREVKDPRLTDMVSVTAVSVDADLRTGKVFLSVYSATREKKMENLEAVRSGAGFIRRELARRVPHIRQIPVLQYVLDESLDYGERIDKLLSDIKNKEEK
ncbi:MAG: 30S ribosome-binding factor RbfA [Clostridiales bacterium]|jgi:ribosome-binding factor A|nr:30S ribosome-binding factor RbfA [Clostridiales bacterium]